MVSGSAWRGLTGRKTRNPLTPFTPPPDSPCTGPDASASGRFPPERRAETAARPSAPAQDSSALSSPRSTSSASGTRRRRTARSERGSPGTCGGRICSSCGMAGARIPCPRGCSRRTRHGGGRPQPRPPTSVVENWRIDRWWSAPWREMLL
ncbi:translation initiation factor IF-2 [Striga asiatica]|uniref:Translation initiation factor IF-2 n=1 Tax=Striga asiatica TaxID=4170 RepID=A0A5A7PW44_STRAF|nr:translation initiation factor IF-2 [Striga asiatica]